MKTIPIFIIVHDQFEILKKSVKSYEDQIKTPIQIIFHNVASTYYETLQYLKEQESKGYKVYHSAVNNHHTVINSVNHYLSENKECEYCVITDPDIELFNVKGDILEVYIAALNKLKKTSVGPMLEIDDIPDFYPRKKEAIAGHTSQFWSKPRHNFDLVGGTCQYIDCSTDTTFQLFSAKNIPRTFPHDNSIRFLAPYSAKHLDWYVDPDNLTPCQIYYLNNSSNVSHWSSNSWKGKYYNIYINSITTSTIYKYIYWCKCKCKNGTNFGDMITQYIYKKKTGLTPICDINGGPKHEDVILGAGSIMSVARNNSIIWGTGIMFNNATFNKPKKILSVRGPLTRKKCLEQGYQCPEIYGDIGLILAYFYNPKLTKKYKIGIIPHYIDFDKCNELFANCSDQIKIIDITNPVEEVINDIVQCHFIMSTSLHGIIAAHAYNIKCLWIIISDKIAGGNTKYLDYYGSVIPDNYLDMKPYLLEKALPLAEMETLIDNYRNPIFPIDTKHILEICPF